MISVYRHLLFYYLDTGYGMHIFLHAHAYLSGKFQPKPWLFYYLPKKEIYFLFSLLYIILKRSRTTLVVGL